MCCTPSCSHASLRIRCTANVSASGMIALSVAVFRRREGEPAMRAAQQLFGFSILYLFLLFAALLAEHGLGLLRPLGLPA